MVWLSVTESSCYIQWCCATKLESWFSLQDMSADPDLKTVIILGQTLLKPHAGINGSEKGRERGWYHVLVFSVCCSCKKEKKCHFSLNPVGSLNTNSCFLWDRNVITKKNKKCWKIFFFILCELGLNVHEQCLLFLRRGEILSPIKLHVLVILKWF